MQIIDVREHVCLCIGRFMCELSYIEEVNIKFFGITMAFLVGTICGRCEIYYVLDCME